MTYIMLKKNSYTVIWSYMSGKKFLTPEIWKKILPNLIAHTPIPRKSHMVNHKGGGGRGGFDTLVNDIHQQMAGARSSCGGFQD